MESFFNNKENDTLKFKLNSEGIDMNDIEPRLILTTNENKNYFFVGKIVNDICKFDIPKLELFNSGTEGKIRFEIISNEEYFSMWEDNFKIKTKSSIKIEEIVSEKKEESKKPFIKAVFEGTEEKKEVKKEITKEEPKKEEPKKEEVKVIKEEKVIEKEEITHSKRSDMTVKHFSDFFKDK